MGIENVIHADESVEEERPRVNQGQTHSVSIRTKPTFEQEDHLLLIRTWFTSTTPKIPLPWRPSSDPPEEHARDVSGEGLRIHPISNDSRFDSAVYDDRCARYATQAKLACAKTRPLEYRRLEWKEVFPFRVRFAGKGDLRWDTEVLSECILTKEERRSLLCARHVLYYVVSGEELTVVGLTPRTNMARIQQCRAGIGRDGRLRAGDLEFYMWVAQPKQQLDVEFYTMYVRYPNDVTRNTSAVEDRAVAYARVYKLQDQYGMAYSSAMREEIGAIHQTLHGQPSSQQRKLDTYTWAACYLAACADAEFEKVMARAEPALLRYRYESGDCTEQHLIGCIIDNEMDKVPVSGYGSPAHARFLTGHRSGVTLLYMDPQTNAGKWCGQDAVDWIREHFDAHHPTMEQPRYCILASVLECAMLLKGCPHDGCADRGACSGYYVNGGHVYLTYMDIGAWLQSRMSNTVGHGSKARAITWLNVAAERWAHPWKPLSSIARVQDGAVDHPRGARRLARETMSVEEEMGVIRKGFFGGNLSGANAERVAHLINPFRSVKSTERLATVFQTSCAQWAKAPRADFHLLSDSLLAVKAQAEHTQKVSPKRKYISLAGKSALTPAYIQLSKALLESTALGGPKPMLDLARSCWPPCIRRLLLRGASGVHWKNEARMALFNFMANIIGDAVEDLIGMVCQVWWAVCSTDAALKKMGITGPESMKAHADYGTWMKTDLAGMKKKGWTPQESSLPTSCSVMFKVFNRSGSSQDTKLCAMDMSPDSLAEGGVVPVTDIEDIMAQVPTESAIAQKGIGLATATARCGKEAQKRTHRGRQSGLMESQKQKEFRYNVWSTNQYVTLTSGR